MKENTTDKMLTLILKKEWFDKIKNGEKTIEYRELNKYWCKRLQKKYDKIIFKNGYNKNAPTVIADFKSMLVVDGNETDLKIDKFVFAIGFDNVREVKFESNV